jgi:hypothetical protein
MKAQFPTFGQQATEVAVELQQLKRDMKRLLRMQWKEFIHFVDDQLALHCVPAIDADNAA